LFDTNNQLSSEHNQFVDRMLELYGNRFVDDSINLNGQSLKQFALNYAKLCIPGWFVVYDNNKPVGFLSGVIVDNTCQVDVAFIPESHRKPVVYQSFKKWVKTLKTNYPFHILIAPLDQTNIASVKLYEKVGFNPTLEQKTYYFNSEPYQTVTYVLGVNK